jgi:predicted RND superfamily exporter protein
MPLAAIFIIAVLALIFRRITDVVFPFLTIAVALVCGFLGIMGHVGIAFTAMLVALAPLLLGITIDYAIHIISSRYNEERAKGESVEVGHAHVPEAYGDGGVPLGRYHRVWIPLFRHLRTAPHA